MAVDKPGLVYVTLDGRTTCWPSGDPWTPDVLDDFDLMQLRTHLVRSLLKVETAAGERQLLRTWSSTPAGPTPPNPTLSTRPEE